MASGARGEGVAHKLVFELRYDYGNAYLDRCGATLNEILRDNPGWAVDAANPQSGMLRNQQHSLTFSFGTAKLDLGQQQTEKLPKLSDGQEFGTVAHKLTTTVVNRLELEEFTRIGFRVWRLFEYGSLEDARQKAMSLGLISKELLSSLDLKQVDEVSFGLVCGFDDCMRRIAVLPVQQKINVDAATVRLQLKDVHGRDSKDRKAEIIRRIKTAHRVHDYPQFSVLVDVDSYVETPEYPGDITADQFVASNYDWSRDFASRIMNA